MYRVSPLPPSLHQDGRTLRMNPPPPTPTLASPPFSPLLPALPPPLLRPPPPLLPCLLCFSANPPACMMACVCVCVCAWRGVREFVCLLISRSLHGDAQTGSFHQHCSVLLCLFSMLLFFDLQKEKKKLQKIYHRNVTHTNSTFDTPDFLKRFLNHDLE